MVMLYICQPCREGNHKKCEKGFPAPPGYFGGSLCTCHHKLHTGGRKGLFKKINKFLEQTAKYRQKTKNINEGRY